MLRIDRRIFSQFSWSLFCLTLAIPITGLVVLYSAGYDPDVNFKPFPWFPVTIRSLAFFKQGLYFTAGFLAMLIAVALPPAFLHRTAYTVYGLGIVLLTVVTFVGVVVNGSRRWIPIGGVNIQPSELAKLGLVLAMAKYLAKNPPRHPSGFRLTEMLVPLLLLGVPMALIARQPDLGTAISLGIIGTSMILFVGVRWKTVFGILLTVAILAYPVWHSLHDYQQRRVLVLLDPDVDPTGSGYHINQSKIAVGSGQLLGKGYLQGTQTQLEFLPEHTTDFIFSVLAEEWGFVGCIGVLMLYFLLIIALLRVVMRSRDLFTCLIVFGVTIQVFAHVVINVGMVIGLMPVVGIPLPLFSYGGSSLLSLLFGLGLAQGINMRRLLFSARE